MWVLDLESSNGGVKTSFYLVAGKWTVGRKNCDFNFHWDTSISRSHATLTVGKLSKAELSNIDSRPSLIFRDQRSRFGSFVNDEPVMDDERVLKTDDRISFGGKETVLKVRYQPFALVPSRLQRSNRPHVEHACMQLDVHLLSNVHTSATHCILDPGKVVATVKVLWSLVHALPIVATRWLDAILERESLSEPLPRCEDFLPVQSKADASEDGTILPSNYLPDPKRKTLYKDYVVIFLSQQESIEDLVKAMGAFIIRGYDFETAEEDDLIAHIEQQRHKYPHAVVVESPVYNSSMSSASQLSSQAESQGRRQIRMLVERRTNFFQQMQATFITIQEIAASILLVKAPEVNGSFFSSLFSHRQNEQASPHSFPDNLQTQSMHDAEVEHVEKEEKSVQVTHSPAEAGVDNIMELYPKVKQEQLDTPVEQHTSNHDTVEEETSSPTRTDTFDRSETVKDSTANWFSARSLKRQRESEDENDIEHQIETSNLIVRMTGTSLPSNSSNDHVVNYKRFRKGNIRPQSYQSTLPPMSMIDVTVKNDRTEEEEKRIKEEDEQERVADQLFSMVEDRSRRKRF